GVSIDKSMSFVFFSSSRWHTRSKRDWSSDVCSSDLLFYNAADNTLAGINAGAGLTFAGDVITATASGSVSFVDAQAWGSASDTEIGRASCRDGAQNMRATILVLK